MEKNSKILVLGGRGLLGSAVVRLLEREEYANVLKPSSKELNLLEKKEVESYIEKEKPEFIFMVAGLVGGILENKNRQADFLYQNTTMILNLLESVKNFSQKSKILYTGSTCIYPKENPQPISEDRFLCGRLEETNFGYAISKICGIVACQKYKEQYGINTVCVMPTNMYGVGDSYDLEGGHFFSSLIKKFLLAKENNLKEITFWGSGNPRRESLFSEDCADALIYLMKNYNFCDIVNIGTNFDYSIREYVKIMKEITDFKGKIRWDETKPDGTFEKRTNIRKLKEIYPEFSPRSFEEGVKEILRNEDEVKRILEK